MAGTNCGQMLNPPLPISEAGLQSSNEVPSIENGVSFPSVSGALNHEIALPSCEIVAA